MPSAPEFVHPGDESEFNRPPRKEAQQAAVRRLMNDYNMIKKDPTPYIFAEVRKFNFYDHISKNFKITLYNSNSNHFSLLIHSII